MTVEYRQKKERASRNRTITLIPNEISFLKSQVLTLDNLKKLSSIENNASNNSPKNNNSNFLIDKTINADLLETLKYIPDEFANLIIIDPPYNLTKNFGGKTFNAMSDSNYDEYLSTWLPLVCKKLKKNGSLYLCGDWKCTSSLQRALEKEFTILNRITWQREKGRGAKANWKNGLKIIVTK